MWRFLPPDVRRDLSAFSRHPRMPLVLICLLYLGVALPNLASPPVVPDEIGDEGNKFRHHLGLPAVYDPAQDPGHLDGYLIGDTYLPLVDDTPYVGAVEIYLQLPLYYLFGVNLFSLRLLPVLISLVSILAIFSLCREWFGKRAAIFAGLLLATHPVFVHFSRQGRDKEEVFTVAFLWTGLYFFNRYFNRDPRRARWLAAGALMFGLGLCHKITFLWYMLGLLVAGIVVFRGRLAQLRLPVRHWLAGAGAFVAGLGLLIAYNIKSGGRTILIMWEALVNPLPKDDVNNLHYLGNLWVRIQQFVAVVLQGELRGATWENILHGATYMLNYAFGLLFLVGAAGLVWLLRREEDPALRRRGWMLYVLFTVVLLCSPFTVSSHYASHLLVMYPFPQIVVALCLVLAPRHLQRHAILVRRTALAAATVVIAFNLYLVGFYHLQASRHVKPGTNMWTCVTEFRYPDKPDEAGKPGINDSTAGFEKTHEDSQYKFVKSP